MKRRIICLGLIIFFLFDGISMAAKQKQKKTDLVLFDSTTKDFSDWTLDNTPDGSIGVTIEKSGKLILVTGKRTDQSFAAVRKTITLNLDEYSCMEADVESANDHWYIIISGNNNIPNGYVRIQSDTTNVGKFKYNIKSRTGLFGVQTFELQLGVSSPNNKDCNGKQALFKQIKFFASKSVTPDSPKNIMPKQQVEQYDLLSDTVYDNIKEWSFARGYGTETEMKKEDGKTMIIGKRDKDSFGAALRNMTINIDEYPFIEVEVESVSDSWYLILNGETIPNGYIRIQPDTNEKGIFKYNIKEKLNLSGTLTFDLQVGVSSPNGQSCNGLKVVLKELKILKK